LVTLSFILAFSYSCYFLRSMLLVAAPLNGWLLQLNKFQERMDHGYCVHKHHSMSDVVLIVDLMMFFDENGGAGSRHKILSSCDLCGWSWWRKISWTTTPGKIAFPRSYQLPSARHLNGFPPFLIV